MSASIETISGMGQQDQFQARCKVCPWGGDIHDSRAAALREKLAHDSDAHSPEEQVASGEALPVVKVEEILAQLEANAPKLAPLYAAHMDACVDAGFTREEALILTSDWARVTLWGAQL